MSIGQGFARRMPGTIFPSPNLIGQLWRLIVDPLDLAGHGAMRWRPQASRLRAANDKAVAPGEVAGEEASPRVGRAASRPVDALMDSVGNVGPFQVESEIVAQANHDHLEQAPFFQEQLTQCEERSRAHAQDRLHHAEAQVLFAAISVAETINANCVRQFEGEKFERTAKAEIAAQLQAPKSALDQQRAHLDRTNEELKIFRSVKTPNRPAEYEPSLLKALWPFCATTLLEGVATMFIMAALLQAGLAAAWVFCVVMAALQAASAYVAGCLGWRYVTDQDAKAQARGRLVLRLCLGFGLFISLVLFITRASQGFAGGDAAKTGAMTSSLLQAFALLGIGLAVMFAAFRKGCGGPHSPVDRIVDYAAFDRRARQSERAYRACFVAYKSRVEGLVAIELGRCNALQTADASMIQSSQAALLSLERTIRALAVIKTLVTEQLKNELCCYRSTRSASDPLVFGQRPHPNVTLAERDIPNSEDLVKKVDAFANIHDNNAKTFAETKAALATFKQTLINQAMSKTEERSADPQ